MADITVKSRKLRNKGGMKSDAWFGLVEDHRCILCGHSIREHGAQALMVSLPGAKYRSRHGVRFLDCKTCAKEKNTGQAMCYQMSEAHLERLEEAGYRVF